MVRSRYLPHIENRNYDGVFSYLANNSETGNILSDGLISVSGSSDEAGYEYSLVFGINNEDGIKYWRTKETDLDNPFIKFDFKSNRFTLGSIMMYTATCDLMEGYHIYGSIGNKKYLINTFTNEINISCGLVFYHFPMNQTIRYQSITIEGNGQRGSRDKRFVIHRIEFFGIFYASRDLFVSCKFSKKSNLGLFIACLINVV